MKFPNSNSSIMIRAGEYPSYTGSILFVSLPQGVKYGDEKSPSGCGG